MNKYKSSYFKNKAPLETIMVEIESGAVHRVRLYVSKSGHASAGVAA